jgi:hypothetical protein
MVLSQSYLAVQSAVRPPVIWAPLGNSVTSWLNFRQCKIKEQIELNMPDVYQQ